MIAAERARQIHEEDWRPEHDDRHTDDELAWAAACYAAPARIHAERWPGDWSEPWPWDRKWDKRKKHSRLRCLVIAGALSYEGLYLINGVNVNENLRQQARPLYVEDAVQETKVSTGNISAEYGRFQGGVVNMITDHHAGQTDSHDGVHGYLSAIAGSPSTLSQKRPT